jgi:hypothetical protein
MFVKNKNTKQYLTGRIEKFTEWFGFSAMSLAAVLSLVELHASRSQKVALVPQPAYVASSTYDDPYNRGEELMRREKEETTHAMVSYGVTMRSHPTSGNAGTE